MEDIGDDRMRFVRAAPGGTGTLWLEPTVNRTSLLYDRLSYVVRSPKIVNRFGYTYQHPEYYRVMSAIDGLPVDVVELKSLCEKGYPARGRKPQEESVEGIPVLKLRNVTGHGIDWDTEYAPDTEQTRAYSARAFLKKNDVLITSTGEGTIGRVEPYPVDDTAITDGHVTICRLKAGVNVQYVVEFLRSEFGQIQMLRHVNGSTGQTELLKDHLATLRIPMPSDAVQGAIVEKMAVARERAKQLAGKAAELQGQSANVVASGRHEMMSLLKGENG